MPQQRHAPRLPLFRPTLHSGGRSSSLPRWPHTLLPRPLRAAALACFFHRGLKAQLGGGPARRSPGRVDGLCIVRNVRQDDARRQHPVRPRQPGPKVLCAVGDRPHRGRQHCVVAARIQGGFERLPPRSASLGIRKVAVPAGDDLALRRSWLRQAQHLRVAFEAANFCAVAVLWEYPEHGAAVAAQGEPLVPEPHSAADSRDAQHGPFSTRERVCLLFQRILRVASDSRGDAAGGVVLSKVAAGEQIGHHSLVGGKVLYLLLLHDLLKGQCRPERCRGPLGAANVRSASFLSRADGAEHAA